MMPNNVLSATPLPAPFLSPRAFVRFSKEAGVSDVHYGGIALGDPSHGITYQLWTAFCDDVGNVWLGAPNTPNFIRLPGVSAVWVALAIDQNAREFIAYADKNGNASYFWFDTTIPAYRTSTLTGIVPRVFAALDDNRVAQITQSDVILAYARSGELYSRQQRDRFGVEYTLGAAPGALVQVGMNHVNRFQFAFQNVQGNNVLPPAEFNHRPTL